MDEHLSDLIAAVHRAPQRLVLAFTGAGSQALCWLHALPGSSRTVLEAVDCYAPRSLAELLGGPPAQAVGPETALGMARWAAARAAALAEGGLPLLGVGCTAAVATDPPRRGADRAHVAVAGPGEVVRYELWFAPGAHGRAAQERLVSLLILRAIAAACGLPGPDLPLGPGRA